MYNVIPMDEELKAALCEAMGCEELEVEPLTGYSVKTHRGTGIQDGVYFQRIDWR